MLMHLSRLSAVGQALWFLAGLALAGSEGELFPWPNLLGVSMICLYVVAVRAYEKLSTDRGGCHRD